MTKISASASHRCKLPGMRDRTARLPCGNPSGVTPYCRYPRFRQAFPCGTLLPQVRRDNGGSSSITLVRAWTGQSPSRKASIERPMSLFCPASSQGLSLGLTFRPVTVIGADAALPIGKYGLRAEVAYSRTQDADGIDPLTKNQNVFSVVGIERTFEGVLNINVQYLYRRTFDYVSLTHISSPITRLLAAQVDLLSNQLAPDMHGASLRINYKAWNETLESEIAAAGWFKKGDSTIRPKVTYAFTDHLKASFGGEIYHGPPQSFFGRLSRTSTAYAELRFGF